MNIRAQAKAIYGDDWLPDGILNPELYHAAPFRVLWLLRETWVKESWAMLQAEGVYSRMGNSPTWHVMTCVTYSLFNQFRPWVDMSYIRDEPIMAESLRSVAYVNVKKNQGDSVSDLGLIYHWFKRSEDLLKQQVHDCHPDIVIGCAPYMNDVMTWWSNRSPRIEVGRLAYVSDSGKPLLIQADHPSYWRYPRELYVDGISSLVKSEFARCGRFRG